MRRPLVFGLAFGLALFGSFHAGAQVSGEHMLVDRVAADFFESDLRLAQSRKIEASTADIYRGLALDERSNFREERRKAWQAMSEQQQSALRGVKTPSYENLAESQKARFRQIAIDKLAPASADNEAAVDGTDI